MASKIDITNCLELWKKRRFRDSDMYFEEAVHSLINSKTATIEMRRATPGYRWMAYNKDSGRLALFTYPFYWNQSYGLETGNLVPEGGTAPPGVGDEKIQREANFKCDFSYTFDVSFDTQFPQLLQRIEDHTLHHTEFNQGNRGRRSFADPRTEFGKTRLYTSCKMFIRRTSFNTPDGVEFTEPYPLHDWCRKALHDQKQKTLVPNPQRPRYQEYAQRKLSKVDVTKPDAYERGDIVLLAFRFAMFVRGDNWSSELIPVEIVRVASLPTEVKNDTYTVPTDPHYQPLDEETIIDFIEESPSSLGKRKERAASVDTVDDDQPLPGMVWEKTPEPDNNDRAESSAAAKGKKPRKGAK